MRGQEQRQRTVRRTLRVRQTGREKGRAGRRGWSSHRHRADACHCHQGATTLFPLLSWRTSGGMYEYVPQFGEKMIYLYFGRASTGTPRTPPAGAAAGSPARRPAPPRGTGSSLPHWQ